jgi:hypothetical protein
MIVCTAIARGNVINADAPMLSYTKKKKRFPGKYKVVV